WGDCRRLQEQPAGRLGFHSRSRERRRARNLFRSWVVLSPGWQKANSKTLPRDKSKGVRASLRVSVESWGKRTSNSYKLPLATFGGASYSAQYLETKYLSCPARPGCAHVDLILLI